LDISVLVNNVGLELTDPYHQLKEEAIEDIITVNCNTMSKIIHQLLPRFLKRKHKSAIINVSSDVVAFAMGPFHIYGATKAFMDYLSRALSF